ncbi:MAG: glycine/sarcosine/betaine reductase selenoprotein B family protein [Pseudomonadota bacterium]|nr:glycine/sarcosine/betaine reductase selenoprotein B family protein [Pseudomonadota bacterium]
MVRLRDLPEYERDHLLSKCDPPLGPPVWVAPKRPLEALRMALLTTAGLHYRDAEAFEAADGTFRPIDGEEDTAGLVMSHSSVNFDKSGFAEDVNLVFPLDRFRELRDEGVLGSLASVHYSFMGAGLASTAFEAGAIQVAALLKRDQVDAVFLTPV